MHGGHPDCYLRLRNQGKDAAEESPRQQARVGLIALSVEHSGSPDHNTELCTGELIHIQRFVQTDLNDGGKSNIDQED
nr:hypothetical protein Iba_chr15dCG8310 [Ipomoea batatas]